jgi:hypothetical protein
MLSFACGNCVAQNRERIREQMALDDMLTERRGRALAGDIGIGVAAFGLLPAVAPAIFARLFGLGKPNDVMSAVMRSLGVRDMVMGIGLWSAAAHGGRYLPHLLSRALVDGGDTLAIGLAVAQGKRTPGFVALGALAAGAAAADIALYIALRAQNARQPTSE